MKVDATQVSAPSSDGRVIDDTTLVCPNGVLVVEKDATRRRRFRSVLSAAFGYVHVRPDLEAVALEDSLGLMVVDYDGLNDGERKQLWDMLQSRVVRWPVLLHSGSENRADVAALVEHGYVCNIIARQEPVAAEELLITVNKLFRGDIFGLEKYFTWGARRVVLEISDSSDKGLVVTAAEDFARQAGVANRFVNGFIAVTDELLTNALFNAPVTAEGKLRFSHLERAQAISLSEGDCVKITFCFDGDVLGVAVADPYGTLGAERLLRAIAARLRDEIHVVREHGGGAGIGLYQTFEGVSQLVVNLDPGTTTEVIGMLDVRGSYREFLGKPKSINVFVNRADTNCDTEDPA